MHLTAKTPLLADLLVLAVPSAGCRAGALWECLEHAVRANSDGVAPLCPALLARFSCIQRFPYARLMMLDF
jgi:hypothetical protein